MAIDPQATRAARRAGLAAGIVIALAGCTADDHARRPELQAPEQDPAERPVVHESRTGIPLLMDLPLIGWLFHQRVTMR